MSGSLTFYLSSHQSEITVSNPLDGASWLEALNDVIESEASNYCHETYPHTQELSSDILKKVAEHYTQIASNYYSIISDPKVEEKPTWEAVFSDSFYDFDLIDSDPEFHIDYSFGDKLLEEIFDELDDQDIEVSNDIREIISSLDHKIIMKIEDILDSNDDTTLIGSIGDVRIPLVYTPFFKGDRYIGDFDIYENDFSDGDLSFIRLTGVSVNKYMQAKGIQAGGDINQWKGAVKETSEWKRYQKKDGEKLGMEIDSDRLFLIFEQGMNVGALPVWIGHVTVYDLLANDPAKPMAFSGGGFGIVDFGNGSGDLDFVSDGQTIVIEPGEFMFKEPGYSVETIFGYSESDFNAEPIKQEDIIELEKSPATKYERNQTELDLF